MGTKENMKNGITYPTIEDLYEVVNTQIDNKLSKLGTPDEMKEELKKKILLDGRIKGFFYEFSPYLVRTGIKTALAALKDSTPEELTEYIESLQSESIKYMTDQITKTRS